MVVKLANCSGQSIGSHTKVRPHGITSAVNDNFPINDKNSLFVHFLRLSEKARIDSNSDSLSVGSFTHISKVSINIPRNRRVVLGPMIFSRANGMPSCSKTLITMSISALHLMEPALFVRKKSSRCIMNSVRYLLDGIQENASAK